MVTDSRKGGPISLEIAFDLTTLALALAIFWQSVEFYWISKTQSFAQIWNYSILGPELESSLPLPRVLIATLFSNRMFEGIVLVQLLCAVLGFFFPQLFVLVLITHTLICVRFRGTFNGGSDMMTFIVLTGVLITTFGATEKWRSLGLIYISIHGLYSYFKAGLVKIWNPKWRSGEALPLFLKQSLYQDVRQNVYHFSQSVYKAFAWTVMLFELIVPLVPFVAQIALPYFIVAVLFHAVVSLTFGLNRFFWIWLSAWPSIFFATTLISANT